MISFDSSAVAARHKNWLHNVERNIGLGELNPQPYWGFDDVYHKAGTKLFNCFYVIADKKRENGIEFFKYEKIMKLSSFSQEKFIYSIELGSILADFDARTGIIMEQNLGSETANCPNYMILLKNYNNLSYRTIFLLLFPSTYRFRHF